MPSMAITWMQRLKRNSKLPLLLTPLTYIHVGNIDIEICERCGGQVKVIASIEDPGIIEHILKHLKQKEVLTITAYPHTLPPERAPP